MKTYRSIGVLVTNINTKSKLKSILTVVAIKKVWAYNSGFICPITNTSITVKKVNMPIKANNTQNF
ncbi:hypothetical protein [Mucilaginibacter dorajii]|uniref:Uncharacterized protein n=1 Tax=Mucilaginibacter dorajii TaxID=692994 RepID=A0ABP7PDK7_9SPHI|nr:hypothetical protein [Mucilaginibacter dorajii]MCS3734760.1 hypothetical protein [Mucilaginibacter dorajii]